MLFFFYMLNTLKCCDAAFDKLYILICDEILLITAHSCLFVSFYYYYDFFLLNYL
jgi:hypothetical protein